MDFQDAMRRIARAANIELTAEAQAYLVQEDDPEHLDNFFKEKLEQYGDEDAYYHALGASWGHIEEAFVRAMSFCFFDGLAPDTLEKGEALLYQRARTGRTVLQKIFHLAVQRSIGVQTGEFSVPSKPLALAFAGCGFATYYFFLKKNVQYMFLFAALAAAAVAVRVVFYFMERRDYRRRQQDRLQLESGEQDALRDLIRELLKRNYPEFDC